MPANPPTTAELRDAFRRSGLWRMGWTYASAIAVPAILTTLTLSCQAHRRHAAKSGRALPEQPVLI